LEPVLRIARFLAVTRPNETYPFAAMDQATGEFRFNWPIVLL
jgi:hypothetical protein